MKRIQMHLSNEVNVILAGAALVVFSFVVTILNPDQLYITTETFVFLQAQLLIYLYMM